MAAKYLTYCLMVCFLFGCTRDVYINIKESEPKIVVKSVTAEGELFEVHVSSSASIFAEQGNTQEIADNAIVSLFVNDTPAEVLHFSPGSGTYKADHTRPFFGNTYRIEVSRPGFTPVSATSTVPANIPISSVIVEHDARQLNQQYQTGIKLIFTDVPGENFYSILLQNGDGYFPCLYCKDVALEKVSDLDIFELEFCYGRGKLILNDKSFEGQEKQVQTYVDKHSVIADPPYYARIVLQHISYDYFRFLTTKNLNEITSDNPFAEPANIVGNIHNGFGIFTIYSRSSRQVN